MASRGVRMAAVVLAVAMGVTTITEHFDTYEGAVSIALEPVPAADWNDAVHAPEITAREHLLIKTPNYRD